MKRLFLVASMLGALSVATSAYAVGITGTLSLSAVLDPGCTPGVPAGNTCSPVLPVAGGALVALGSATGLDFTTTGVLTPGVVGNYGVDGASGDFAPFNVPANSTGTIRDFTFTGAGSANYPSVPVANFELGALGFIMDLLTVNVIFQDDSNLILRGTGLFHLTGFENTVGTFNFAISNTQQTFSFAASEAVTAVPEPGTMVLLGTGLIGAAALARRRKNKA